MKDGSTLADLWTANRRRLRELMQPRALAVVNANDVLPTNADGTLRMEPGSDLYYLTGVEQEETVLLMFPDADDEKDREILFLREQTPRIATWEGPKLTPEEARRRTGIRTVLGLGEFPAQFHRLMCECEAVYLNANEHKRAVVAVETRDARFVAECQRRYPLHRYERLARLMHRLRSVKSPAEINLIRQACSITGHGFRRALRRVKPGVCEAEIEAEFACEFIRRGGRFAYTPIIAAGRNACALHYIANNAACRKGDLLLMDVAARFSNYNSDLTRTVPVSGRFTRRQRQVYEAVLRVFRQCVEGLRPGKRWKEWQKEAEQMIEGELVGLGRLSRSEIRRQDPDRPVFKKYFMHGVGHPIGLDVHDVGFLTEPFQAGWVMTVEPGIYLPEEGFGIRLENTVVIGERGNEDLMAGIPIEADEIEALMGARGRAG
ncbi:MAG: aminopeptidase P N-terminal domain-containing protein [Verrucomicrobia bacterium]|nr:aminopeptidase P N-terminal domain-containing protein [Verrucomicrobiota bacterium]